MNKLEELSAVSNHGQYLERMAKSSFFSTKQNIPPIIASYGCKTVLDVGCADGAFTKRIADETGAEVTGLDINSTSIELAKSKFPGINFICSSLFDLEEDRMFDCIVFCSVLHEVSSYCAEEKIRYTDIPIRFTIERACKHLNPGGIIVIREMVKQPGDERYTVEFKTKEYSDLFKKFTGITKCDGNTWVNGPGGDFLPLTKTPGYVDYSARYLDGNNAWLISKDLLIEFLLVATWGKESWDRETKERKLICKKQQFFSFLKDCGLAINSYTKTNEEYPKYWRKICHVFKKDCPETTCLIVAQKQ